MALYQPKPRDQLKAKRAGDLAKVREKLVKHYYPLGADGWIKFMVDELKYYPDKCMIPVIYDLANYRDTTTRACHGVGKTALGANIMLTALMLVPSLYVLQVSPTWRQVKTTFWKEVRFWFPNSQMLKNSFELAEKSPILESYVAPQTWQARGLSTSRAEKAEGVHNKHVLLLVDEAKGVEDDLMDGLKGALTSNDPYSKVWRGYFSTPGSASGKKLFFYRSFTKMRHKFKCHKITAYDSPRVSQSWIDDMIDEYGVESSVVQSRVMAEFATNEGNALITLEQAESLHLSYDESIQTSGIVSIGIDVARFGQDESVVSVWKGNTLIHSKPFTKQDTIQIAGHAFKYIKDFKANIVVVDEIGVGGGVVDALRANTEMPADCFVFGLVVSSSANDKAKYANLGSEIMYAFAERLRAGLVTSAVNDDKLEGQLTAFRLEYDNKLRIRVTVPSVKRDQIDKTPSPDRAESAIYGWYGMAMYDQIKTSVKLHKEMNESAATDGTIFKSNW